MLNLLEMFFSAFLIERGIGLFFPAYRKLSWNRFWGVFLVLWGLNGQYVKIIESANIKLNEKSYIQSSNPSQDD